MFLNFNDVLYVLNYVLNLHSKSTFCFVGLFFHAATLSGEAHSGVSKQDYPKRRFLKGFDLARSQLMSVTKRFLDTN